jgi:DNA repair protein RadD
MEPPLWAPQQRGLDGIDEAIARGKRRVLLTSPTGSGKSRMMRERVRKALGDGKSVILYTNRKMLLEQTAKAFDEAGIHYGIRADGYKPRLLERVQLSSIQTEDQRVYQTERWELHRADEVLIDEAHVQKGDVAGRIIQDHLERGADAVIGFTATPLDLDDVYEELVVAGNTSDYRACGALVPAITYAPDEPAAFLKPNKTQPGSPLEPVDDTEVTEKKVAKAMPPKRLFGRVLEHWKILNPEQRPAILFAPGVKESLYFAEQFYANGIPAAHVDGSDIWINGKFFEADSTARDYLRECSETGRVKIVCNRYVLREGIDWPHLYHGIFATTFGSAASYLQSGGRLLRQWYVNSRPQLDHVIIQDHGGNWHRHGSLNSDREWDLSYTARLYSAIRKRRLRERDQAEPIVCPRCHCLRLWGRECFKCHYVCHTRSRLVLETDGKLKEMKGDIYQPRRLHPNRPLIERKWRSCYFRAKKSRNAMTFEQAMALCAMEMNWMYPPTTLPLMPTRELDWFRAVKDVPTNLLIGDPHAISN